MAASENNAARLWDAASGKSIAEPMKHENRLRSDRSVPMVSGWITTALRDGRRHPWMPV